jgi:replicative DNA helicase
MFAETTDTQMDKDFGKFGQKFQLATLSLLIQDKAFANKIKLIIKSEYFDNKYNQFICETILTFIDNYHCQPDFETLKTIIETQVGTGTKLYLLALNSIKDVDLTRKEFVEAECAKFCFTRHALSSLEEERAAIMNGKFDKAREVAFQKYKPLNNASSEVDLKKDYTKALSSASRSPVPTPLPSMNMVSKGGPGAGDLCIIVAQSNFGKCFAKGTEVLMQDLSIRKVEDIKTNDKVMGWDGKPRTITSLAQGQEEMYEIKQDDGTSYTVNESHILVLKPTKHYLKNYSKMSESLVKIEVKDYIKKSATWRKNHKGIKVGVDNLSSQTVLIDPYYLGLWLGDGSSANQSITNKDEEVVSYLKEYAEELLLTLSSKNYDVKKNYEDYHSIVSKQGLSNVLLDNLRIYGLLNNKHIPFAYLNNDRQARLELLAGLLDSDGYLNKQTKTNFEISQINYTLAADIAFLARSLGFKVREREVTTSLKSYDYKGKAIKLLISGDTHLIPTKIARKQAIKRKTNKRHDCLTISVVSKGLGNYYGFTISDNDPDKMFLLKDFTVVHNTNYLVATAKHAAQLGKKVLFFSLETDNIQLMQRILAGIVNVNQESLSDHPTLIESKIKAFAGELKFIEMKSIHARVDAIKAIVEEKKSEGFFPDMIIVDGLNQVKPPRHERFANANDKFEYLAEELRDMAKELRLPVYAAFQSNRGGFNVAMADEQNIGKAIEVYQVCDWMLLFTQTLPMQDAGECYVQLLKNRLGPKGLMLKLRYNPGRVTFEELESVNRSLLLDESKREGVAKGLDTMKARLDAYRKKSGT